MNANANSNPKYQGMVKVLPTTISTLPPKLNKLQIKSVSDHDSPSTKTFHSAKNSQPLAILAPPPASPKSRRMKDANKKEAQPTFKSYLVSDPTVTKPENTVVTSTINSNGIKPQHFSTSSELQKSTMGQKTASGNGGSVVTTDVERLHDEMAKLKREMEAMNQSLLEHNEWIISDSKQVKELAQQQKQLQMSSSGLSLNGTHNQKNTPVTNPFKEMEKVPPELPKTARPVKQKELALRRSATVDSPQPLPMTIPVPSLPPKPSLIQQNSNNITDKESNRVKRISGIFERPLESEKVSSSSNTNAAPKRKESGEKIKKLTASLSLPMGQNQNVVICDFIGAKPPQSSPLLKPKLSPKPELYNKPKLSPSAKITPPKPLLTEGFQEPPKPPKSDLPVWNRDENNNSSNNVGKVTTVSYEGEVAPTPPPPPPLPSLIRESRSSSPTPSNSTSSSGTDAGTASPTQSAALLEQIRQFSFTGQSLRKTVERGDSSASGTSSRVRRNTIQDALENRLRAICGEEDEESDQDDDNDDSDEWDD